MGPISKGRGGKEEWRVNEGEKEGRKKEFGPPNLHHRSTPLITHSGQHCRVGLTVVRVGSPVGSKAMSQ